MDFGTFERGGQTRRAATPAQAVKLKYDGWRRVEETISTAASTGSEFEHLTVAQLQDYATEHDIDLGDAHRKQEVIAALVAATEYNETTEDVFPDVGDTEPGEDNETQ